MNNKHFINDIKRIFLSIKEHKKDSILIFLIVFALTTFMMIYWVFYLSSEQMSNTIKDNVKIKIEVDGGFLEFINTDYLNSYLAQQELSYSFYVNHIKELVNMFDELSYIEGVSSSPAVIEINLNNNISDSKNYVYSYDEKVFYNDNLVIKEGMNFGNTYDGGILANSYVSIQDEDGNWNPIELDDVVTFTNSNDETFSYKVIGIFDFNDTGDILSSKKLYNSDSTAYILPIEEIYKITTLEDIINISYPTISVTGYDNSNKVLSCINSFYEKIEFPPAKIDDDNKTTPVTFSKYEATRDDSMYQELQKPIRNIKVLFQAISIFMIIIMFVLLCSFILCVLNSRIHDFGIFIALGQSKMKTIFNFLIEILLISFFAYIISIPISFKLANNISEAMVESNLKRQQRIAIISDNEDNIDVFNSTKEAYKEYSLELTAKDYLCVFGISTLIIFISQASALIVITSIKPKKLLTR